MTQKYYSTTAINKKNAVYNVIFGERSNGKTFALLKQCLKSYFTDKSQMAYVRRWKEDITGRRASQLFAGINAAGLVETMSGGLFTGVHYYAGKWYLCNYDEKNKAVYSDVDVIAYAFALSDVEHDKSTSFPLIKTIVFDEFLSSKLYLNDEFVLFMNVVSTIVRRREDVKIYMLGNTVNKYCPYFEEMGLVNILKMEQGTIDVYQYGESTLTVAVEYCATTSDTSKTVHKYFAFDNPKLQMITGGAWEMNLYPHLPMKYNHKNIMLTFFIDFAERIYQCEVICVDDVSFIYIHDKTTPIKDLTTDLIYSLECKPEKNYNRSVYRPTSRTQEKILWYFKNDRVFYQDNNVGDAVGNYLKICKKM